MKKVLLVVTILNIFFFFLISPKVELFAQVSACPESMPTLDRYNCLQNEMDKLEKSQSTLQNKLKNEDYQQLSLSDKIAYINTQVSETERVVNTLHMEILTQDIEIKLLTDDIQALEDKVGIFKQEVNQLEETVNKRVMESYKYSYVGALEIFLDIQNIENLLRKTKYLIETRAKDKISLEEYKDKVSTLEEDEKILAEKKAELQTKRNTIEEEKEQLVDEKNNLDSQKAEQSRLLAESQRREQDYKAQLATLSSMINNAESIISEVTYKLLQEGKLGDGAPVTAGQFIGRQGHTGCSFGSHLHFEIRNSSGAYINPANYLTINGTTLTSGSYISPYRNYSAYITQSFASHGDRAIDMVTFQTGNQNYERYTVPYGLCSAVNNILNSRKAQGLSDWNLAYLTGEGAGIHAIASGRVYYSTYSTGDPNNPTKYAYVKHNDGNTSFYLHIQ